MLDTKADFLLVITIMIHLLVVQGCLCLLFVYFFPLLNDEC